MKATKKMKKTNKIRALSLIELMILIISLALIIALSAPLISKKILSKADIASHGVYICYYKDGQLWEARYNDKNLKQEVFNRKTQKCMFNPPKKNALYQVTSIGGGGGGGDAGYLGGMKRSDWKKIQTLAPDYINEDDLWKNYNIKIDEFKKYAGKIYFYALGAYGTDSGEFLYTGGTVHHKDNNTKNYYCDDSCDNGHYGTEKSNCGCR